jgi:hypothetical protein
VAVVADLVGAEHVVVAELVVAMLVAVGRVPPRSGWVVAGVRRRARVFVYRNT